MFMLACITKVLEQVIYIVVICNRMLPKYNVTATLQVYSAMSRARRPPRRTSGVRTSS